MNGFHSFFLGLQNFFGSSKIRNYLDIITCKWQLRDDLQIRQLLFKFKEMNPKLGKEPQFWQSFRGSYELLGWERARLD